MEQKLSQLLSILDRLLGPGGCPWDLEQTLKSLRSTVFEETCEVIDAIDSHNAKELKEELGDLLFNVVFLARLAEKEYQFTFEEVILEINEKLIRRHPHVFGDIILENTEQVMEQWEAIKQSEQGKRDRKYITDGIPTSLPSLSRAQKIIKRADKLKHTIPLPELELPVENEEELGKWLLSVCRAAEYKEWDAELALRHAIVNYVAQYE